MRKLFYKLLIILVNIILAGYLFAGYFPWLYKQFDHEPIWVSYSPDRRFSVASYAVPFLPFRIHYYRGIGCGDCPGYIRLIDNRDRQILQEKYIGMLESISSKVYWGETDVLIRGFAAWPLPER